MGIGNFFKQLKKSRDEYTEDHRCDRCTRITVSYEEKINAFGNVNLFRVCSHCGHIEKVDTEEERNEKNARFEKDMESIIEELERDLKKS